MNPVVAALPSSLVRAQFFGLFAALVYTVILGIEVLVTYPTQRITDYYLGTMSSIFILAVPFALVMSMLLGLAVFAFLRWVDTPQMNVWFYGLFIVLLGFVPVLVLTLMVELRVITPIAGWFYIAPLGALMTACIFFTERRRLKEDERQYPDGYPVAPGPRGLMGVPVVQWSTVVILPAIGIALYLWMAARQRI